MANRVQQLEYQSKQLMKVVHHIRVENNALLSSIQSIQAGVSALLDHCDIQLQQPVDSASNPIQINKEEDTPS